MRTQGVHDGGRDSTSIVHYYILTAIMSYDGTQGVDEHMRVKITRDQIRSDQIR